MEFNAKRTQLEKQSTACAVVFFTADKDLFSSAMVVDQATGGVLTRLIKNGDLKTKAGESSWLHAPADAAYERVLAVCLGGGESEAVTEKDFRKAVEQSARALTDSPAKNAVIYLDEFALEGRDAEWQAQVIAEKLTVAAYRFTQTKSKNDNLPKLGKVTLACEDAGTQKAYKSGLAKGEALGKGVNLARELGNLPANVCTPTYLANQAKTLGEGNDKLDVKVLSEKQMQKLGMGSLLSVAAGSEQEAQLIVMEYKGGGKDKPHVLVGKGITFDTGGISLKPGAGMDEMKFDMCGAASVFGTIKTLVEMKAPVNVVGIVAATENMPSGNATKPGDVVTSMSGQTIEVLNTDAEGRLVLCDALTYAERFKPKSVVDIATLTGACVVALGKVATGLFSNDQELADALLKAGEEADDRAWQMPLWDDYLSLLDSNFADMANIGGPTAGSITAACFLSRFTKKYKWAHLDIAGTAWLSGKAKGATGRPVGLLVNYLLNKK